MTERQAPQQYYWQGHRRSVQQRSGTHLRKGREGYADGKANAEARRNGKQDGDDAAGGKRCT
jgi:hypothetical protein